MLQAVNILVLVAIYAGVVYVQFTVIEPALRQIGGSAAIVRAALSVVHGAFGCFFLIGVWVLLNVIRHGDYRNDAMWPYGGLMLVCGGQFGLLVPWLPLLGGRTRRGIWLAVLALVGLGVGYFCYRSLATRPIPSFPHFDLGEDYAASYQVSGLSDIGPYFSFYLAIEDPEGRWFGRDAEIKELAGSLRLQILDGAGNVIAESSGRLSDHVWSYQRGAHLLYSREPFGPPEFSPKRDEQYTLRISYTADPKLTSFTGYGYLKCRTWTISRVAAR